ncbi:hypothetical protein GCM10022405_07300 [Gibbsiella dentisursi]|uniref:Beta-xylosidase n=1 Tax=Gibbsiella dentisursi TaxID=796890 RepID=A0ABP7KS72_9GAMM
MNDLFSRRNIFNFVSSVLIVCSIKNAHAGSFELYRSQIKNTREDVNDLTSDYVYKKLMKRSIPSREKKDDNTQFGVHGMERPAVKAGVDYEKVDKAFELLARAGVDSLRSSEAAWHRVADKNGNPTNFNDVDFQLKEAKKYGMNHLFVVGYPPAKFTVSNNKLSAVSPRYYSNYQDYLEVLLTHFKGYDVKYLELGNEVDAPNVWWIRSTPAMYVNEMRILKNAINKYYSNAETVAFSATYSRTPGLGGPTGGRNFINKSFMLGIDKYTDAYSLHHFSFLGLDDLPDYMHSMMKKYQVDNKKLLDTEQLDTSVLDKKKSNPYDIVKLFARAFFFYDMKRMDYYLAKDTFFGNKIYNMGLFDINWQPKLRLLAYAMAVDAMKGKKLLFIANPEKDVEAYVLYSDDSHVRKYTIVMWKNSHSDENVAPVIVTGIKGEVHIEKWNLDVNNKSDISKGISIDEQPLAIYTDKIPDWKPVNKNVFLKKYSSAKSSHSPMPNDD